MVLSDDSINSAPLKEREGPPHRWHISPRHITTSRVIRQELCPHLQATNKIHSGKFFLPWHFSFQNYLPAKAHNVTHKITPALLTNASRELFSLCVIGLGSKANERSASWSYKLLGHTPEIYWGMYCGQAYMQTKRREIHINPLRVKGTLTSEPRFLPPATCNLSHATWKMAILNRIPCKWPFSLFRVGDIACQDGFNHNEGQDSAGSFRRLQ